MRPNSIKDILKEKVSAVFSDFQKYTGENINYSVNAADYLNLHVFFTSGNTKYEIRNITETDFKTLDKFRAQLGERSKELFCPYPWDSAVKFKQAVQAAIKKSISGVDASYVMLCDKLPVGHFFLWKAGGNGHSLKFGVDVPELGVAIADNQQGRGFGLLAVNILKAVAESLNRDAIELTTDPSNDGGWRTYVKAGFEYLGDIRNPLEVDVTQAVEGKLIAEKFRIERQMVYIINSGKDGKIRKYLEIKRMS